jgi:hypothetical protein
MKRKYAETAEERYARMAKDRASGLTHRRKLGGGVGTAEAAVDTN